MERKTIPMRTNRTTKIFSDDLRGAERGASESAYANLLRQDVRAQKKMVNFGHKKTQ